MTFFARCVSTPALDSVGWDGVETIDSYGEESFKQLPMGGRGEDSLFYFSSYHRFSCCSIMNGNLIKEFCIGLIWDSIRGAFVLVLRSILC